MLSCVNFLKRFSMSAINSRLYQTLPITTPLVLAPMAGAAGGALAAACARAGALGLIGGGYGDLEWVKVEHAKAYVLAAESADRVAGRSTTPSASQNTTSSASPNTIDEAIFSTQSRLGMGFITWRLDKDASALDWVLDQAHKPAAIMFSFGNPARYTQSIQHHRIPIICQAQRVDQVSQLIDAGADIIVAQGGEAGGHGMRNDQARGTFTLVPEIADWLAKHSPSTLLLAAGGIADGRGLAAAMMLGADGGLVGSRLWVTQECLAPVAALQQAVNAKGDDTARSSVFDVLRDLEWPAPYDFRALRNETHRQWEQQIDQLRQHSEAARKDYVEGVAQQDFTRAHVTVGEATGLIHDIPPATTVIESITQQARALQSSVN
jgi:nitronate monooxygenase